MTNITKDTNRHGLTNLTMLRSIKVLAGIELPLEKCSNGYCLSEGMDGWDFTDPSRIEVNRSEKSLADALPSPMFGRYDPRLVVL
jgi:hypothetical protein